MLHCWTQNPPRNFPHIIKPKSSSPPSQQPAILCQIDPVYAIISYLNPILILSSHYFCPSSVSAQNSSPLRTTRSAPLILPHLTICKTRRSDLNFGHAQFDSWSQHNLSPCMKLSVVLLSHSPSLCCPPYKSAPLYNFTQNKLLQLKHH